MPAVRGGCLLLLEAWAVHSWPCPRRGVGFVKVLSGSASVATTAGSVLWFPQCSCPRGDGGQGKGSGSAGEWLQGGVIAVLVQGGDVESAIKCVVPGGVTECTGDKVIGR